MPPSLPMLCGHALVTGHYLSFPSLCTPFLPARNWNVTIALFSLSWHLWLFIPLESRLTSHARRVTRPASDLAIMASSLAVLLLFHCITLPHFSYCSPLLLSFVTIETLVLLSRLSIVLVLFIVLIVLYVHSHGWDTGI